MASFKFFLTENPNPAVRFLRKGRVMCRAVSFTDQIFFYISAFWLSKYCAESVQDGGGSPRGAAKLWSAAGRGER